MTDPVYRTMSIRLTPEDQRALAALQKHTGVTSTSDIIRMAMREACRARGIPVEELLDKTGTEG